MQSQNANHFERLKVYLSKKYKIDTTKISEQSSLLDDLEIYGDDLDEFLSNLIKDFNIEVKEINLSRFDVGHEDFDFITPLLIFFKRKQVKPAIRISDINSFISTGILR